MNDKPKSTMPTEVFEELKKQVNYKAAAIRKKNNDEHLSKVEYMIIWQIVILEYKTKERMNNLEKIINGMCNNSNNKTSSRESDSIFYDNEETPF